MSIGSAAGDGPSVAPASPSHDGDGSISISNAGALFLGDYSRQGHDLLIEHDGTTLLVEGYFAGNGANLVGPNGAFLTSAVVEALAGPAAPGQYAQAGTAPAATALAEIGKVVSVEGTATATHSDGVTVDLANGDPVYQGDVVRTGAGSKLGISFVDDSVFSMSADARMVLDELVFDPAKVADSSMVVNLVQGSFVFVTGQIAPAGNMKVETPVATMGIRGTTPKVLINTDLGVTEFTILPDPGSGKIGSYLLLDKTTGEILGTVESVGDKWVITSLSGEAVKLAKSGLDLLEDERALADIRDAVSNALGKRTEYDGSNSFQQVAFDSSSSAGNQGDGTGGPNDGGGPGGGNGGVVDPTPDKDDPPIAGDDAFSTNEDLGFVANVINASGGGADVDPDGFALTVTQVNGDNLTFSGGTDSVLLDSGALLVIGQTGGITYDPNDAYEFLGWSPDGDDAGDDPDVDADTDTFTYTVRDQNGFTDTATVAITISGRNDRPEIDEASTDPDDSLTEYLDNDISLTPDLRTRTAGGVVAFSDVDASDTHIETVGAPVVTWTKYDTGTPAPNDTTTVTHAEVGSIAIPLTETPPDTSPNLEFAPDGTLISVPPPVTGEVEWTYTVAESDLDFLAAGEKLELIYTIRITDDSGVGNGDSNGNEAAWIEREVKITVTGTNDVPVIMSAVLSGTINDEAETQDPSQNFGLLKTDGSISFADVDLTDRPTASFAVKSVEWTVQNGGSPLDLTSDQITAIQNAFSISPEARNNNNGEIDWKYWINESAVDFLGVDEVVVAVFTITVSDGRGGTVARDVTITINGASADGPNDAPVITTADQVNSTIVEYADGSTTVGAVENVDAHTVTGSISFADVDLTDDPTASVNKETTGADPVQVTYTPNEVGATLTWGQEAALRAAFTIAPAVGNANNGMIDWTYTVNDGALDFLAVGEKVTLVYTVAVNDGSGTSNAVDKTTMTITVTGTNDVPVITSSVQEGTITETVDVPGGTDVAPTAASGSVAFNDVDLTDDPTASVNKETTGPDAVEVTYTPNEIGATLTSGQEAALRAAFTITPDGDNANSGTIDWSYAPSNGAVDFLATGEKVTLTYTIVVNDGHGGIASQPVTITITGSNDAPVITSAEGGADLDEAAGQTGEDTPALEANGTIAFTDVDVSENAHGVSVAVEASGVTTGLALDNDGLKALFGTTVNQTGATGVNGSVDWTFDAADQAFDYLADGEVLTLTYAVTVTDAQGATADQDVTITITGTNDQPVLTADATGGVTEDAATPTLTDTGTLSVIDVDATDVVTPSATLLSGPTWSGGSLSTILSPVQIAALTSDFSVDGNSWHYSVANSLVDFLGEGETITFSYTVTATDDSGTGNASDTELVTITITGTNDAPVIASATAPSFAELEAAISIAFTDADLSDVGHSATVSDVYVESGGPPGLVLTTAELMALVTPGAVVKEAESANGSAELTFSATALASAFDYLDEGETTTLVYTVAIADGEDGVTPQSFAVTIEGTAGGPAVIGDVTFPEPGVFDVVLGTGGANSDLAGDAGRDWIVGLAGADTLLGDAGNDQLFGGEGADQLDGGDGSDTLTGGEGPDQFFFLAGETGVDTITDFDTGEDSINLDSLLGPDFDPSAPIEISLDNDLSGNGVLSVNGQDVVTLVGISETETINIIYDDAESFAFSNSLNA